MVYVCVCECMCMCECVRTYVRVCMCVCVYVLVSTYTWCICMLHDLSFVTSPYCFVAVPVEIIIISQIPGHKDHASKRRDEDLSVPLAMTVCVWHLRLYFIIRHYSNKAVWTSDKGQVCSIQIHHLYSILTRTHSTHIRHTYVRTYTLTHAHTLTRTHVHHTHTHTYVHTPWTLKPPTHTRTYTKHAHMDKS